MPFVQQERLLSLDTPLGADAMLVRSFWGWEGISAPFRMEMELVSENDAVDLRSLLAANVTLRIALIDNSNRYWNGRISKIVQASRDLVFTSYRAEVVPWFSFLQLRQDCRIFQDKTVQDIVSEVFSNLSYRDFEFRLHGNLPKRDYCVQYRETDFHFVSRLLEEEGIFYFFEHENGRHTMVMANTPEAHAPCPGGGTARCLQSSGGNPEEDHLTDWNRNEEFLTSSVSLTDYNFKTPTTSLLASLDGNTPFEVFDYPGLFQEKQAGESRARIRLEEISSPASVIHGESTCRTFTSGCRFKLLDHYRQEWNNVDYVLTEVHHTAAQGSDYHAGSIEQSAAEGSYRNRFVCIPHSVPFRPLRSTPRPFILGCQTAVVVGPSGEEIYTDDYGRVKVQFHWDRQGKKNESSSCWIRVAQPWAGKGWGAICNPRVGDEVVVEFQEGDPDRPLVTGCVYNNSRMPPYTLPGNQTQSGIKTRSSKGGQANHYNEIRFEDKKGSEELLIQAERNLSTVVEADESRAVGHNRETKIGNDETVTITGNRTEDVDNGNETITIHTGNRTVCVNTGDDVLKVLSGDQNVEVNTGSSKLTVTSADRTVSVPTGTYTLTANKVEITGMTEITLTVGPNTVKLDNLGVTILGTIVKIN